MIVEPIERGLEAREQEKKRFFNLIIQRRSCSEASLLRGKNCNPEIPERGSAWRFKSIDQIGRPSTPQ